MAIIAILVVQSYPQWGAFGETIFGFQIFGVAWSFGFAQLSKWVAVFLTMLSGSLYLWRNRQLYLEDM